MFNIPSSETMPVVFINKESYKLDDNGLVHLGTTGWFREVGSKIWKGTDANGRACMKEGKKYEVIYCPEGAWPGPELTLWQRFNLFLHRIADKF